MVDQFGSDVCVRGGQVVWLEWGKSRLRKEGGRIWEIGPDTQTLLMLRMNRELMGAGRVAQGALLSALW